MKKKRLYYYDYLFFFCVICEIAVMLLAHFLSDNSRVIVYGNFMIEISTILYMLLKERGKIVLGKTGKTLIFSFIAFQILSYIITSIRLNITFFDIHKLMMSVGMMISCYYVAKNIECPESTFEKIIDIIMGIGIVSTIYNTILNIGYLSTINLSVIMYYGWNFRSFFPTRAVYGSFISICAIISLYRSEKRGRTLSLVLYCWFAISVIVTSARSQMIALILGSVVYLLHSKKYKRVVIFGTILGVFLIVLPSIGKFNQLYEKYFMFFDHSRGRETDITTGRIELWLTALENMNVWSWIVGNGLGSKDTIMALNNVTILGANLSSFHSGYIDLFFETGLFGLALWGNILVGTIKQLKKYCPRNIFHFFISVLSIILVSNAFDSCYMIVSTDTMTTFSSFVVVCLPCMVARNYANRVVVLRED